ncbi:MAG: hypothetical protein PHO01_03555, partial [Desulfotomaculaceae bacterium]|nr:hypothetical protein [Desulfotomaculaceae bacterium]
TSKASLNDISRPGIVIAGDNVFVDCVSIMATPSWLETWSTNSSLVGGLFFSWKLDSEAIVNKIYLYWLYK